MFESVSAGVIAVAAGMAAVLVAVDVFVVMVWPLTFWDPASLGLEKYASWTDTVLWMYSREDRWRDTGVSVVPRSRRGQNATWSLRPEHADRQFAQSRVQLLWCGSQVSTCFFFVTQ